jgi:hypothetical protein
MIKLAEILHHIDDEAKSDYVPPDDWRLTELDYFDDMGFVQDGNFALRLHNPPLRVSKKKKLTHELSRDVQAVGEGFVVEDMKKKKNYTFPTFKHVVEFFDNYEQDFKH